MVGIHLGQAVAGFADNGAQAAHVQRLTAAVGQGHADARVGIGRGGGLTLLTLTGVLFAVQYVAAGDLLLTGTHQGQFDLVLDFFDVQGAAGGQATLEDGADGIGQIINGLTDTRGRRSLAAFHGQKGLGHGDADFVVGVGHQGAVALDNAQLTGSAELQVGVLLFLAMQIAGGGGGGRRVDLHDKLLSGRGHEMLYVLRLVRGVNALLQCRADQFLCVAVSII